MNIFVEQTNIRKMRHFRSEIENILAKQVEDEEKLKLICELAENGDSAGACGVLLKSKSNFCCQNEVQKPSQFYFAASKQLTICDKEEIQVS